MSRRTMPLKVRALGPLVPSPGKGPADSRGMVEQAEATIFGPTVVGTVVVGASVPAVVVGVGAIVEPVVVDAAAVSPAFEPHPTRATAPAPANSDIIRLRLISVARSNVSPR